MLIPNLKSIFSPPLVFELLGENPKNRGKHNSLRQWEPEGNWGFWVVGGFGGDIIEWVLGQIRLECYRNINRLNFHTT